MRFHQELRFLLFCYNHLPKIYYQLQLLLHFQRNLLPSDSDNVPHVSNTVSYLGQESCLRSGFLVNLTASDNLNNLMMQIYCVDYVAINLFHRQYKDLV